MRDRPFISLLFLLLLRHVPHVFVVYSTNGHLLSNHPLHLSDILHDIFLKTGNGRDVTHGLLCGNLTDKVNSTSRYPDHITTSILDQCTYLLNSFVRPPSTRSPISSFHVTSDHMTNALLTDTRMQNAHPTWCFLFPHSCQHGSPLFAPFTITTEFVKKWTHSRSSKLRTTPTNS